MVVLGERVTGQHIVVEEATIIHDTGDQLDIVLRGRVQNELARPGLHRAQNDHRPVDQIGKALDAADQIKGKTVCRSGCHAECSCQARRLARPPSHPTPKDSLIARQVGIVQQQQIEALGADALQASLE